MAKTGSIDDLQIVVMRTNVAAHEKLKNLKSAQFD
jgi:hypothetical protein